MCDCDRECFWTGRSGDWSLLDFICPHLDSTKSPVATSQLTHVWTAPESWAICYSWLWMVWGQPSGIGESLFLRCVSRLRHSPSGCHAAEYPATLFLSFLCSASNEREAVEHLELQRGSSCWALQVPRRASLWAAAGRQMEAIFPSLVNEMIQTFQLKNCRTLSGNTFFIYDKTYFLFF